MAAASLRDEVTGLLQELLRLDTVNPPGNETRAAELLRDYLEPRGVECRLYARVPERASLVARIRGRDPAAPRLLFLSHTDTVLADPAEWSVDPWSGELRGGCVWGRGALDMKGQVAASAVALAALAREGFEPEGDLVFAATADEEVGEGFGLSWLCAEHPEAVRAAWCVNEGGGDRIEVAGRPLYLCATSEKATAPFTVRVRGRSGHASTPGVADNALVKAASVIERLGRLETPLWRAIEAFVAAEEPRAGLVPVLLAGFTDSHFLRETFGTIAYGFFPLRAMAAELAALLVHSADERAAVDDLELGTRFLAHVARELLSGGPS